MLVTRFAPTPSGYLHEGNIVNLVLTHWLAQANDGMLLLRIDDFDQDRVREAYIDDIFRTIDWLGVDVGSGPGSTAEFRRSWSMSRRMDQFRAARDRLLRRPDVPVFVCRCSRTQLDPGGRCVRGCADEELELVPGESVLRLSASGAFPARDLPPGDHVLWRRDDRPSYQLGSVVADEALGVTAVVRGMDLRASSALQVQLAMWLPAPGFAAADLRHHQLLAGPTGRKLSKSAGDRAQPIEHSSALRDRVLAWATVLGAPLGIGPP
jgi:glutamyl-tRNA synthetase